MPERTCPVCGSAVPPSSRRPRVYCSKPCRRKASRKVSKSNCTLPDCGRPHVARGLCSMHWRREYGKRTRYPITCQTCGIEWMSGRPDGRYCSDECKGKHYAANGIGRKRIKCPLPVDHPVMVLIAEAKAADSERRRLAQAEAQRSKFAWRTARECPGCACWFTPLHTPNAICCSHSCSKRCARRRRRAREAGARGSWTWAQFMAIARKFDYCCAYCGTQPDRLDPDHVVPLSRGGYDSPSNLLPTCLLCNSSKNAMTLDEWAAWRAARGMEQRVTTWTMGDSRYVHLTQALLGISPAA